MDISVQSLYDLEKEMHTDFQAVYYGIRRIRERLQSYSDNKVLKGDEIVGWYGEICCRTILGGVFSVRQL